MRLAKFERGQTKGPLYLNPMHIVSTVPVSGDPKSGMTFVKTPFDDDPNGHTVVGSVDEIAAEVARAMHDEAGGF